MYPEDRYKLASFYESQGGGPNDNIGVRVLIASHPDRELTEEECRLVSGHVDAIVKAIRKERATIDPQLIQERRLSVDELRSCFPESIFVEEIPNEYCHEACCMHRPWLIVTTGVGRIKVGWRKRVINIDWSGSTVTAPATVLFPDEDTTKMDRFIHAWGLEKAREYIAKILEAGGK